MLGNRLAWISCKFILFYPAQDRAQELCAIETLSLTPLAIRQPSQLIFSTCLYVVYGEIRYSGSKVWEAQRRSRGQEGLSREILPSLLRFQLCIRVTNTAGSIANAANVCSSCWSCWCELGEGRKLPAKKAPFGFKFLPDHGVKVVDKPAVICPNKHKS